MPIVEQSQHGQWVILIVFFSLFFISGLMNKPRMKQMEYYHFYLIGLLIIALNVIALWVTSPVATAAQELIATITLKHNSLESSLIVFGYCLISRGLGQFLKTQFGSGNTYSKRIKF